MKQLIVLIATIILGVAIGGIILGFSETAETLKDSTNSKISGIVDTWSGK